MSRYGGYVMQYLGDGILAALRLPRAPRGRRPARRARRARPGGGDAGRRAELDRRFGVAPEVRVGIHTGRVVVTDLSADRSVAERDSIVGLVTNLAARIQQAAEPGTVVISDVTQQLVDADFYVHVPRRAPAQGHQPPGRGLRRRRPALRGGPLRGGAVPQGRAGRPRRAPGPVAGGVGRRPGAGRRAGRRRLPRGRRGRDRQVPAGRGGPRPASRPAAAGCSGSGACPTTPTSRCGPMARLLERVLGVDGSRRRPARGAGRPPRVARAGPGAVGPLPRPAHRRPRDPRLPRPGTRPERLPRRDPRPARGVGVRARRGGPAPARGRGPALGRPVHARPPGPARRPAAGRPAHAWRPPGTRPPSPGPGRSPSWSSAGSTARPPRG